MIVAQAVAADGVLVTHGRVFRRVRGLKVEDWSNGATVLRYR
jgi:predicted nucleic acid-binding protein